LEAHLIEHLDIEQALLFGGLNGLVANSDAPFGKDNNFYFYDSPLGPRLYFPWDLDTVMKDNPPVFGAPGSSGFTEFFLPFFEDELDTLLTDLLAGPLSLSAIEAELTRAESVAAAFLDADPFIGGDGTSAIVADLRTYWINRHAQLSAELAAH
jgi:hypothetical protein